jgi:hypothetical protein
LKIPFMPPKSQQLQIRVTPLQKSALRRHARAAGLDVSAYVLSRLLPPDEERFAEILRALRVDGDERFALAELNDFLASRVPTQLAAAVARATLGGLSPFLQNYVAAMVEQAAGLNNASTSRVAGRALKTRHITAPPTRYISPFDPDRASSSFSSSSNRRMSAVVSLTGSAIRLPIKHANRLRRR